MCQRSSSVCLNETNLEDALGVMPLIKHGFDLILPSSQPKPDGAFIGLSP
jgi:hypothetical protein